MKRKVIQNAVTVTAFFVSLILLAAISLNAWNRYHETESESEETIASIQTVAAGTSVNVSKLSDEEKGSLFFDTGITEEVLRRINGVSYHNDGTVTLDELRYLRVLYMGVDGKTHVGELIVNQSIAKDVLDIMKQLYQNDYPIERMELVDNYNGDDEASMNANNTSAYNDRVVSGSNKLSKHAYGLAIDVNPLYNPYVKTTTNGNVICDPESSKAYVNRDENFLFKIDEDDLCYQLFTEHGFTWGGSWAGTKDYQHFEK